MDPQQQIQQQPILKKHFEKVRSSLPSKLSVPVALSIVVVILAGVGTGYFLSQKGVGEIGKVEVAPGAVVKDKEVGIEDVKTFRDSATGVLREGGVNGEGTHHLEREGGPTQNVYLTSSVIDLDEFVDHNVTVWGETHKGQKAGWLMDVGKIKIIE